LKRELNVLVLVSSVPNYVKKTIVALIDSIIAQDVFDSFEISTI